MRLIAKSVAFSCALFLAANAGAQSDQERAGARSAANQGVEAFEAGNFKDALNLMERAESLVHALPHLLYIARANEKLGNLVQAREAYLKIGRERLKPSDPDAFRDAQSAAATELQALEPRIPTVTVKVEGAPASGLSVTMDGQPLSVALLGVPTPMNPGEHVFEAKAPGTQPATQRLAVAESAKQTVTLALQPGAAGSAAPDAPATTEGAPPGGTQTSGTGTAVDTGSSGPSLKIPAYIALGVGVVGVAAGTVFYLSGSGKSSDADKKFDECVGTATDGVCRDPAAQDEIEELDSSAASNKSLGVVGFAVGGVGLAAGVTLLLLDGGGKSETPTAAKGPSVTPLIGYRYLGLSGRF